MEVVELGDGTKIEINDETEIPPPYSTVDSSSGAGDELAEARQEFKQSLFGHLPRKRRLKLRGKEVELSSHLENATMYSLARDWVKTKYYRPPPSALQKSSLPPPSQKWNNLDSNGRYHSPLVPPLYPFEKGNPNLTNKKDILNEHMIRWKRVAQDWKNQSKANDERYSESYKMLHETAKTLLAYDE